MSKYFENVNATAFPPGRQATREEIMNFCQLSPTGFQRLVDLRAIRECGLILPPSAREVEPARTEQDPRFKAWLAEQAAREKSEKLPAPLAGFQQRSPESSPVGDVPPAAPFIDPAREDSAAPTVIVAGPTEKIPEAELNRLNGIKEPTPEELNAPILGGKDDEAPAAEPMTDAELERLTAPETDPPPAEAPKGKKKGGK